MADSFYKLEDEAFPSFLCKSLDSTSGRATLGNVTLGSGPGLPVAASTVAKIRPASDNRGDPVEASYLEGRELQLTNLQSSVEQPKFALSFKDELDNADDFIAAHRLSDKLVKINLDESASRNQTSMLGIFPTQMGSVYGRPTELGTDLSTGLLTFAQFGHKDSIDAKSIQAQAFPAAAEDDHVQSEAVDTDRSSGSNSSFLANEKLMSVDSMNSDVTDDDIDLNNLPDDELELYFNKLVPPAMQRGRVEGQEIPATGVSGAADDLSNPSSTEPEHYRHQFLDQYDQEDFQMPDVRLAATGMDSCPASDEDTEDELESARRNSDATRTRLLPSTSRQLVGESNRPSFRPGLEGGSSDDEASSGRGGPSLSGIEHRRSAEGQVINPPVTGDGGGGDGSSGSEESGNDGGVSTIPLPAANVQTTYDTLRGLGIVGSSAVCEDEDGHLDNLPGHGRNTLLRYTEMGDRVGPVGTGEASSSLVTSGGSQRLSPVNWSMVLDRQEALDAMESTDCGPTVDRLLDSVYLRSGAVRRPQDSANLNVSHLQGIQGSFHLSQVLLPDCDDQNDSGDDDGVDEPDGARPSLGLRGGPCGDVTAAEASDATSEDDDNNPLSTSLEAKYFSQSFHQEQGDSDDGWSHCPDNLELEFQQGANAAHSVVYQNEEGQWVTDLAYYSVFEKEVDGKTSEIAGQFQMEEFVPASDAMEKIVKDQEEFEKEHQFMQEEQIEPASSNTTFHSDSSWKIPANSHVLMRASQVSSGFNQGDESYLRLSLGEFFGQRSEALGCLGSTGDVDVVKRPSFGYSITSPEKREPFPLIHPSEFSCRDGSPHSDTMELSEADKTLNPEDLDKTLEAPGERMSPKGDTDPEPCEQKDHTVRAALPDHCQGLGSESSLGNQSYVSPDKNSSQLMLSISTIASAIADASISTDPSQLAAMIMELSKRSRARNRSETARPVGPAVSSTEELASAEHVLSEQGQSAILDKLQRSTCVGEMSAFDMEKYLKKTDVSGSSDCSVAHTTFDLSGWVDSLSSSQRNPQTGFPEKQGNSAQRADGETITKTEDGRGETTLLNISSSAAPLSNALSPANRCDSKGSSIPRPRTSSSSARRSVGSGQSSSHNPPADKSVSCDNTAASSTRTCGSLGGYLTENGLKPGEVNPQAPNIGSLETPHKNDKSTASSSGLPRTYPGCGKGQSGLPCLKGSSPPAQMLRSVDQQQQDRPRDSPEKKPLPRTVTAAPLPHSSAEKHIGFSCQNIQPPPDPASELPEGFSEPCVEETHCNFRPSTSPLTHSSPSQTSVPSADGMFSPSSSSGGLADRRPALDRSPQSTCSSPSISRLTYISMNDGTAVPTPERQKNNATMALSTTIVRFSPTPPMEPDAQSNLDILGLPKSLDQVQPQHSKSLDPLPAQQCKSPEPSRSGSALSCTRSQSECNYHCPGDRTGDISAGFRNHKHLSESNVKQLTKVDSGYCSNLNIQQASSSAAPQSSQQWGTASSVSSSVYAGGLGMPPSYSSDGLHYVPIPSFKPQCPGMIDLPHQGDMQSLLTGRSLFNSQLAQQYLGPEAPLHPGAYHVGTTGNSVYSVSSTGIPNSDLTVRHIHPTSGPLGISGTVGPHHLSRPHQSQREMGMMGKPYNQYGAEPLVAGGLEELRGQVVVPEELRFPHACCVGIASQTSLSLFNPSERWQQVSITVTSLAIDGEKVDSLPYQWLMVKNKTIIGPKSTEEQKVLFIPPQAGVYQCILSVCSWPACAETEVAARANIFAKRVVLVAIAENPAVEIEVSKSGCVDFGDLPGGSAKSLPLKLLNRTHATVPIRLVISANATAWRCFTFSKHPVTMTSEGTQQAGHMPPVSSPSVMNHVMHASYGENPENFMVWVHFKAPQKYAVSSGELGPADEFTARVDVEVDSPGPSHVIRSIPLRARSGTARVHAPKDLQIVSLSAPLGKSSQQTLPLKNAGNIDVQLKLKISDCEDSFSVTPDELCLRVGEEQSVVVSFKAQGNRKWKESLLTILVLPSGPQYEVTLKGEVIPEDCGKPALPSPSSYSPGLTNDVPPILSNKQFVAWGGVTLGRAVQQKLVLRNNSTNATQQLRLLIRGQDQDCFQLQSMFSPEQRVTRHGELSIRPREDVTVHLLFAPTRVACMLAKLEIKQSGVRPSQPGVKFTIPLSGYGGTSNIILEDQRKQADGYVAALSDIAVGHVSKVCLCVRNTGSRAAFIKAVAFSDLHTRSVMEPSVISLAPSQFVLKERTQEVITVLMKSTEREQSLCHSANTLLATVCLFCGDEVSRQQYRRLLQSKPEVARKALSENSLLKNIDFNENFLGEENVTETYGLPQRPNEAHIFYGNMSKVVVSLLGSTKSADCEESEHTELLLPSARHGSETDSGSSNGNVSLDVLPVKGPQGPALRVAEPSLKASEPLHRQSESWTIHPEQLVLAAPTINGASTTSQVQIHNNTSRELSFDLSWPAHCLTITPQHGLIEPQCHLQILISPNPSLATKSTLLPWSGQIYVQCDGQQKSIKVQIRRDLALDVSTAPADTTLSALPPQAATPLLPVARLTTKPSLTPQTQQTPPALVEISNKTIIFPTTPSGETSEAQLEVQNGEVEVRWYLSSFAPPYVKGVDNTGDVYRATYTAFRCSKVSGTLGAHEKMQVPITFLPRDRGDYAQFWDLECHPVSEPQQKTRIRFQLCGTGARSGPVEGPQEGDCSLVKTEATVKTRKRAEVSADKNSMDGAQQSSPPVLAVIGEYYSEISLAVTTQLNLEYIPQISYGSTSGHLGDKIRFPSFMRTVPEDDHQAQAIIKILTNHQWTWVGVVSTDSEYGRYAVERLRWHATNNNICFAFTSILSDVLNANTVHDSINSTVRSITENENVTVIVSFAKPYHMMYLFRSLLKDPRGRGKVWLASDNWSQSSTVLDTESRTLSDVGTVYGITLKSGNTTKFERYLHNLDVNPDHHKNNPFLNYFLKQQLKSDSANRASSTATSSDAAIQALLNMIYPYAVFSVELAVEAVAQAVVDLCTDRDCKRNTLNPLELREALKKAKFFMDGKNYSFDDRGDLNSGYDVILWRQTSPAFVDVHYIVAHYSIENQRLSFSSEKAYQDVSTATGSVISRCSTTCAPGFRRKSAPGQPVCCYQCHPCPENYFSNSSDSTECHHCNTSTHYSPQGSSECRLKTTIFLTWTDRYHIVLLVFTALGAVLTLVVGIIFLAGWNTPVVRSSVGPICILLLFSLLCTFVSVILFGGEPSDGRCQARQVAFGLSFTLCVSCIMVKSFKIILAFEFDPGTHHILKKLYKPYIIIAACMAGQVLICVLWLVFKPPEPNWEPQKKQDERLMYCNEKLYPAFGAMLSYIGLLALICFGVAFKGRKLPQCYNDAKFITFAMLIYFISWIIFGPVYANVTGRYLPAVEMVVILISAYGILFCQFITKCYIILFKQEANTVTAFCQNVRNHSLGEDREQDGNWPSSSIISGGIQNPALSMESLSSAPLTDRRASTNSGGSVFSPTLISNPQPAMLQNDLSSNRKKLQRYFSLPASALQ